jgi:hypothetical protein
MREISDGDAGDAQANTSSTRGNALLGRAIGRGDEENMSGSVAHAEDVHAHDGEQETETLLPDADF